MPTEGVETDELLEGAAKADGSALSRLLDRHRQRLRRMLAARLDRRLAARVDPSDIVQETLADASRRLPEYLRERSVPYWTWLRRLGIERVIWWRRFHLVSNKRTVAREQSLYSAPSEQKGTRHVDLLAGIRHKPQRGVSSATKSSPGHRLPLCRLPQSIDRSSRYGILKTARSPRSRPR